MQSSPKDVDTYIQQAPEDRREALTKLRNLCRRELKGFEENIFYGMPGYSRRGAVEIGLRTNGITSHFTFCVRMHWLHSAPR